jgi:DNA-binding PadR family transcriptional regulator
MDKQKGSLLRGHLEMLVLATVARGPTHGYDVLQQLEQDGCGLFHLKEGTVYPVLYRLEEAGQVKGEWEAAQSGRRGPRRRIYKLTPKGRRSLDKQRNHWAEFTQVINNIVGASA